MAKAMCVGVNGVARKVSKQFMGVSNVARSVKNAYVGVSGVARGFFSGLYYVEERVNPNTSYDSTYTFTYGEGTLYLEMKSRCPTNEESTNRCRMRARLYGLSEGDVISFDYVWDTSAASPYYYQNLDIYFSLSDGTTKNILVKSGDSSGTATHTVTAAEGGRPFTFMLSNGRNQIITQKLTVTNLTVNGSPVTATAE